LFYKTARLQTAKEFDPASIEKAGAEGVAA
jgi:hypothetical protein